MIVSQAQQCISLLHDLVHILTLIIIKYIST